LGFLTRHGGRGGVRRLAVLAPHLHHSLMLLLRHVRQKSFDLRQGVPAALMPGLFLLWGRR